MAALLLAALAAPALVFSGSPPLPPDGILQAPEMLGDSSIEALQDAVLDWYLYMGYPFAGLGMFMSGDDTLAVAMVPGRRADLEEVRFEGLESTRPGVLVRLLPLSVGEPYDPDAVERWQARMERLDFIEYVGRHRLMLGPRGNLVVLQPVIEGPAGSFEASMGFSGEGGSEELEGGGSLEVLSLFGTGRQLTLSVMRSPWGGVEASGSYLEPWIMDTPLSVRLSAAQEVPDSAYLNRELEIILIWELREDLEVSAGTGFWRGYEPGDETRTYDYGLAGIRWRPGRRVPQGWEGLDASLEGRMGTLGGPDSSGTLSLADLDMRGDVFSGVLGLGGDLLAGGIIEGEVLESRLERLGGQETIRGYAENSFRASRWIIARPEVSLGETSTRLYAFSDIAFIDTPDGVRRPCGAGIGIRGRSGLFSADAAVGVPLGGGPARFYFGAEADVL
jgi:hypothetical protein